MRYVVEGSVRRAGNRVRITAQLIDAVDDTHLWAERYDRALEAGKRAVMLDAADPFAHVALSRVHSIRAEHESAILHCERAISLNPSYSLAHFGRAHSLWMSGPPGGRAVVT